MSRCCWWRRVYVLLTFIITRAFRIVEAQIPQRR